MNLSPTDDLLAEQKNPTDAQIKTPREHKDAPNRP